MKKKPILCAVENDGKLTKKIELFSSAHNYYLSHEKTQRFWAMRYRCKVSEVQNMHFEVEVGGYWFPVHYYFMPLTPFSHVLKRYSYQNGNIQIQIDEKNEIHFAEVTNRNQEKIWLYYDCSGVQYDNGLLQFKHDADKKDGIKRYYIVSDERQREAFSGKKNMVLFGSRKHQKLFLQAEKVITAYIEENNIFPFKSDEYDIYAGRFRFKTIYLQHGVLHIDMPWKYTPEKVIADRIVVSTEQEAQLWIKNGYEESQLWKYKMPRFEYLKSSGKKKRKILFALSWRAYLTGNNIDHHWELLERKFLNSSYYKKIQQFLNADTLGECLGEI